MELAEMFPILIFLGVTCLIILLIRSAGKKDKVDERIDDLKTSTKTLARQSKMVSGAKSTLSKLSGPLAIDQKSGARMQELLHNAGFYHPQALAILLGVKTLLLILPWLICGGLLLAEMMSTNGALVVGACTAGIGMIGPTLWLERKVKQRQALIRKGLPDLLDLLVVCLEGGLSLPASFQQIIGEFRSVHPALGQEIAVVQWESQFGETVGSAFERLAQRSGVEEIKGIATAFKQSEQFGAGLVSTLRALSSLFRFKLIQQTEERAAKAGTQILFPTLLFIFPGIFVILLGPAALQMKTLLKKMNKPSATSSQ